MKKALVATLVLGVALLPNCAWARFERCSDLAPPTIASIEKARSIEGDDLIRLRDIGQPGDSGNSGPAAITVSPDGRKLAFQLRRSDVTHNDYCLGIFVFDLLTRRLTEVDAGGELIRASTLNFAFANFPDGVPTLISPKWSPDGRSVAFLKQMAGRTQVWRAFTDAKGSEQISDSSVDVDDFTWTASGEKLIYSRRPALSAFASGLQTESLKGFHFDRRYYPSMGSTPLAVGPISSEYRTIDIASRNDAAATQTEVDLLTGKENRVLPAGATLVAWSRKGALAWASSTPSEIYGSHAIRGMISARTAEGRVTSCQQDICAGNISGLWWSNDGTEVRYMRREGWANSQIALYLWRPSSGMPRRVFATNDVLAACQPADDKLICLHEASTVPRHIVIMRPSSGKLENLFDPNPEFGALHLGIVERLHWRNDVGLETIGDLILPPSHEPGQKHPLVIVQYETRGFLRGGTGDEYPIQWLAANGYAVLSFQRPRDYAGYAKPKDWMEFARAETKDWIDRRSVQSSLETGIQILIAKGVVDQDRIGITGLSDGASTASFAIINSRRFAAASLSTCCSDRTTLLLTGEVTSKVFESVGYPTFSADSEDFWKPYALALNPDRAPPLLLQLSEDEYMHALATYTTLKDSGRAIDMFVFPDEHHVKWQPAHRSVIYKRNLAWFDFWLRGVEREDLVDKDELSRWKQMRNTDAAQASHATDSHRRVAKRVDQ